MSSSSNRGDEGPLASVITPRAPPWAMIGTTSCDRRLSGLARADRGPAAAKRGCSPSSRSLRIAAISPGVDPAIDPGAVEDGQVLGAVVITGKEAEGG